MAALILAGSGLAGVESAPVPRLYGAAFEREDTGIVDVAVNVYESIDASDTVPFWNASLHVSDVNLPWGAVCARGGITDRPFPHLAPSLQEIACSMPLPGSLLQIGIGCQPLRKRVNRLVEPAAGRPGITEEYASLAVFNSDRFLINTNGIFDVDSIRHVFYGADADIERWSGFSLYRTIDYENNYDYIDYTEYGEGDGAVAFTAGIGYWRDFLRHDRPFKFLWLIEGFYDEEQRALRQNDGIVPWLLAYERHTAGYQYEVHTNGYLHRRTGARLRFTLCDRYSPTNPALFQVNANGGPRVWFASLEQVGFTIEYANVYRAAADSRVSNVYPLGFNNDSLCYYYLNPLTSANHGLRLFLSIPPSTPSITGHLFGRIVYGSRGSGRINGNDRAASWNMNIDLWLGAGALLYRRFMIELSYKLFSMGVNGRYYSYGGTGSTFFEGFHEGLENGRLAFGVRMVR